MTLNDLNYENTSIKDFGLFRLTQEIDSKTFIQVGY